MYWLVVLACWALPVAAQAADAVLAVDSTRSAIADSVKKYRFLAKSARDKGEQDAALGYYHEYLKYRPEDEKAHFFVGEILYERQDLAGARQAFQRAVAVDSVHVNSNLMLFRVWLREGQPDSAAPYLERVLRLRSSDPKYARLRGELAESYRAQGRLRPTLDQYLLLAAGEASTGLLDTVAALFEQVGDSGQALAWRQRLLATQQAANGGSTGSTEEQRRTLDGMVELQVKSGDLRGALASLDRLVQLDSLNRYTYYRRIVQVADLADDRAARIRGLEGMVRANPADLESLTSLAELLLGGGSPSAAGRWIDQGLKAAPRNGHLQLLRGDLLVMQGADEEAIAAFERAKADPSWRNIAQQRIWQLRPPETAEERLKREFFGAGKAAATDDTTRK